MGKRKISILGSTGSIGENTLRVIRRHLDEMQVWALTAHRNQERLLAQAQEFGPVFLGVSGADEISRQFARQLPQGTRAEAGAGALIEACKGADLVVLAVVGMAGLPAFEYCLRNGIAVAFATKEALVCGGRLARDLMDENKAPVLPVDSELSAIFQCLQGERREELETIWLTASGGPFRTASRQQIEQASVADALQHPNWSMGAKITVDCASMVNKGLEVMETRWLFDVPAGKIRVAVHPQSIIHSMVEFKDRAILAQLGSPDMKIPIAYALRYPHREPCGVQPLDLFSCGALTFEQPDPARFPCLQLAYRAIERDDYLQLVFNSANEVAVDLFLREKITFPGIYALIAAAMERFDGICIRRFDDIYAADGEIRAWCAENVPRSVLK